MKFINLRSLFVLLIFTLLLSEINSKYSNYAYKSRTTFERISSQLQSSSEFGNWPSFLAESSKRAKVIPGDCVKLNEKCRNVEEIKHYAYKLASRFLEKMKFPRFYFNDAKINLNSEKYSKFLFSLQSHENKSEAFLFKVCVPSAKELKAYVDINCPIVSCKKKDAGRIEKNCDASDEFNIKKGIVVGGKVFRLFNKEFRAKMNKNVKRAD